MNENKEKKKIFLNIDQLFELDNYTILKNMDNIDFFYIVDELNKEGGSIEVNDKSDKKTPPEEDKDNKQNNYNKLLNFYKAYNNIKDLYENYKKNKNYIIIYPIPIKYFMEDNFSKLKKANEDSPIKIIYVPYEDYQSARKEEIDKNMKFREDKNKNESKDYEKYLTTQLKIQDMSTEYKNNFFKIFEKLLTISNNLKNSNDSLVIKPIPFTKRQIQSKQPSHPQGRPLQSQGRPSQSQGRRKPSQSQGRFIEGEDYMEEEFDEEKKIVYDKFMEDCMEDCHPNMNDPNINGVQICLDECILKYKKYKMVIEKSKSSSDSDSDKLELLYDEFSDDNIINSLRHELERENIEKDIDEVKINRKRLEIEKLNIDKEIKKINEDIVYNKIDIFNFENKINQLMMDLENNPFYERKRKKIKRNRNK